MRKKITFMWVLLFSLILTLPAKAQQKQKIPVIGWLSARPASVLGLERFRPGLNAIGYTEGKNIVFQARYADNSFDRLPPLAAELVDSKDDVIVTPSTIEAVAAKNATKTIPIVFLNTADPVASQLVDSLARPGGNITGMTNLGGMLAVNGSSYSRKRFPKCRASQCYGSHERLVLRNNGKKAISLREN